MSLQTPTAREASAARPARDLEAFLALVSSLSGKLAGSTGDAVEREVDAGLRELLSFFDVEQYPIAPQWTLVGYADLGGGGSDFTWQAIGGIKYTISPTTIARFGYRYLKVDYHRDDFLYNMATGGIYAGVGMRFLRPYRFEEGDSYGQH
jgi:opacity protein-like surface antigen